MSELATAIDGLAAVDIDGLPAAALGVHIRAMMRERNRLDGQIERALAVFDQRGCCSTDGAPSTASWLRGRCRISGGEASGRVRTARTLRDLPATAAALEAGAITLNHARAIAMLASDTDLSATQRVEEQLVALATVVDAVRFSIELRRLREAYQRDGADGKDTEKDGEPDDAYRRLSVAASFKGRFHLEGWLTPEAGALLKTALDALARPVAGDSRTVGQRYADAVVELARRQMDNGNLPAKNGVRPHLFVMAQGEAATKDDRGVPETLRLVDGQVVGGGHLSDKTLERLACDATISRVLFGPDGHVLDLGRSTRVVSPAQWRALLLRDGGCVVPGHDCPAAFTQAHHLRSWLDGGPTDLWNLASVCTYSHTLVHEHGFVLYLDGSNRWVLRRPDGTELVGLPLGQTRRGDLGSIEVAMINGPRGPCGEPSADEHPISLWLPGA
jgi:hypothetical protein